MDQRACRVNAVRAIACTVKDSDGKTTGEPVTTLSMSTASETVRTMGPGVSVDTSTLEV
jgi:hypothetical protein